MGALGGRFKTFRIGLYAKHKGFCRKKTRVHANVLNVSITRPGVIGSKATGRVQVAYSLTCGRGRRAQQVKQSAHILGKRRLEA